MKVLSLVHQQNARSGVFAEAAAAGGHELEERTFAGDDWEGGGRPPDARHLTGAIPGDFGAVLVFGGAMNVGEEDAHPWLREESAFLRRLVERGVPTMAVCLGSQLLAAAGGGKVTRSARPEIGWHDVELTQSGAEDPVLGELASPFRAFQWHGREFDLPPGGVALARNHSCLQAYRLGGSAWGIQFHAEVTRDTALGWLTDHRRDDDALRIGFDPGPTLAETERQIGRWNELGREICGRFLAVAERAKPR